MAEGTLTTRTPSRDDPILDEVTRRLVEACHPDRIYLFGSAARGDAGPDSDYDILLVVPDDAPSDVLTGRRGKDAIRQLPLACDVVAETRTYFCGRLHLKASLPATVLREGKLLYAVSNGRLEMSTDPTDKAKETAEWLKKAKKDLLRCEFFLTSDPPDVEGCLFFWQQAAEKAFKGFLMWHDVPFRKTHKLKDLGEQCVPFDATLAGLPDRADKLSDYVWEFRYPGVPEPTMEQGQEALALARETYDAILTRVPPDARP